MLYLFPPDRRGPDARLPLEDISEAVAVWPELGLFLRRWYRDARKAGMAPNRARAMVLNAVGFGMTAQRTVEAERWAAKQRQAVAA